MPMALPGGPRGGGGNSSLGLLLWLLLLQIRLGEARAGRRAGGLAGWGWACQGAGLFKWRLGRGEAATGRGRCQGIWGGEALRTAPVLTGLSSSPGEGSPPTGASAITPASPEAPSPPGHLESLKISGLTVAPGPSTPTVGETLGLDQTAGSGRLSAPGTASEQVCRDRPSWEAKGEHCCPAG